MSSFFNLAYSVLPHRKNLSTGKFEVLKNPEKALELARTRLAADPEPVVNKTYFMNAHDEEFTDMDGNWDEVLFQEWLEYTINDYIGLYASWYVVLITFDVPRMFSGGISYGDSDDITNLIVDVAELGVFREPVGDELVTAPEDWVEVD